MTIRVAVVGLGWMGRDHARVLAAHPEVELVAVVDRDPDRAARVAADTGARPTADVSPLLTELDAVSVCTPDAAHEALVVAALDAGARVLVEKPMATSVAAAKRMLTATGGDDARLTVGHLLQHDARVVRARAAIQDGALGRVWHARVRRHASRAVASHVAGTSTVGWFGTIHDAELLLSVMPADAVEVRAAGRRNLVSPGWDVIDAAVEFADGSYGTLHESWTLAPTRPNRSDSGFTIVAEHGSIDVDLGHGQVLVAGLDGANAPDVMHYPSAELADASDLQTELHTWIRTVRTGRQHGVGGRRAARAVALVAAVHDSLETGRPHRPATIP
ncbi:Gfo/Idh/MocA family protein [Agromyces aerolatus]|uniref:Gfo/Idh/MocA family protein n=1 Tax=Agromyces sp. LY-1074 TaxID=3074080 RepID=UPI00285F178F|nr:MULTISPECIES: Gfo/Idh/MocA family oxidoreductase [unclassified Agromyces]MDR5701199.1 Gfo/Idh/MocA family oxidoreductase [Agromyces sp. LY-1074]MDR5706925.1 Gfo/Idh/MocA family oxidoreductase [Agromyces sp. LY-1358]